MLRIATEHSLIMTPDSAHKALIDHIEKDLERRSYPRLQMMLIVSLTGATGFLASAMLLRLGLKDMGLRYPVSVLIAYGAFLALLWLWIRNIAGDYSNIPLEPMQTTPTRQQAPVNPADPVGALGGVQGLSAQAAESRNTVSESASRVFHFIGDIVSSAIERFIRGLSIAFDDSGELVIPLLVILFFVGMGLASFYVVATAPALLAELVVDSTLSYSLYKRLARTQEPNWLRAAVTRTLWPLVLTTLFLALMGWVLSGIAPGAYTLGEVLAYTPPVVTSTTP